jgi:hypothetical protein
VIDDAGVILPEEELQRLGGAGDPGEQEGAETARQTIERLLRVQAQLSACLAQTGPMIAACGPDNPTVDGRGLAADLRAAAALLDSGSPCGQERDR